MSLRQWLKLCIRFLRFPSGRLCPGSNLCRRRRRRLQGRLCRLRQSRPGRNRKRRILERHFHLQHRCRFLLLLRLLRLFHLFRLLFRLLPVLLLVLAQVPVLALALALVLALAPEAPEVAPVVYILVLLASADLAVSAAVLVVPEVLPEPAALVAPEVCTEAAVLAAKVENSCQGLPEARPVCRRSQPSRN